MEFSDADAMLTDEAIKRGYSIMGMCCHGNDDPDCSRITLRSPSREFFVVVTGMSIRACSSSPELAEVIHDAYRFSRKK